MTAVVYSENYRFHDTGDHVENNRRAQVIMDAIKESGLLAPEDLHEPVMASREDLLRVHTSEHVDYIREFSKKGGGHLDFDTAASARSYEIAKLSAGGAVKAAELVLGGYTSAYSIGRPPGHHATRTRAMGFCIFNNLAITLEYLRKTRNIKRFLVFDFDVHYGNGTAEIFYQDPDVLYISIHQEPHTLFPGRGYVEEIGEGNGRGTTLNIPMSSGLNSHDYMYMLDRVMGPVAQSFNPEFYLVDVGFDGHRDDPLSGMNLDDEFFRWIAVEMMDLAPKLTLILEGGYDLNVLSRCNVNLLTGLENYRRMKEEYEKDNQGYDDSGVHQETKNLYKSLMDIFSPYFEL